MGKSGKMSFKAKISKGFCSCLIRTLDGAEEEEILMVDIKDFVDMNLGSYEKAKPRDREYNL